MALIRWNPATELMNLHAEMDRLFNEVTQGLGWPSLLTAGTGDGQASGSAFLPVDIERTDNALVIHASVPGFKPEEVNVTVENGVLTIEAQHSQEQETKERNYIRRERFHGRLYRQIALGEGVDENGATATFSNGVLTVTVPLLAKPEPKRIPVQAAQS